MLTISDEITFERMRYRDNGRGYHYASYAITAPSHESALTACKAHWKDVAPVEQWHLSSTPMEDGRYYCTWSFDSGD